VSNFILFYTFFLSKTIRLNTKLVISELVVGSGEQQDTWLFYFLWMNGSILWLSQRLLTLPSLLLLIFNFQLRKHYLSDIHKVQIFWEGHNIFKEYRSQFYLTLLSSSRKVGRFFQIYFCGLLRIYELYGHTVRT
jgi:hypothetical protein